MAHAQYRQTGHVRLAKLVSEDDYLEDIPEEGEEDDERFKDEIIAEEIKRL
jgi:hypothetical protein